MDLGDVCEGTPATLNSLDLSGLMSHCKGLAGALDPSKDTPALVLGIVFGILVFLAVLIHRLVQKKKAHVVILEALEGLIFFGPVAGYAGAAGGLFIAELAPPYLLGVVFIILALLGLFFAISAAARGDGDAGLKVLGFIHFLVLIGGLSVMAAFCFLVPSKGPAAEQYKTYLLVVSVGLGVASGINAIFASVLRGLFYVVGFFFLVINGTWGFIGNLLGLMTHFASLYSYKDYGKPHEASQRICFVCYESGFSLKSNAAGAFAFSEGAVMSASNDTLRQHEGVHVGQHYLFGPAYVISHFIWFAVMIIPGLIGAAVEHLDAGEGITRMSYYNNPWEVMAYGFINPTGRVTTDALIWGWVAAVLVCVIYVLGAGAGLASLLAARLL